MSPVFCHLLERFFSFVFLFSRSDWKKLICFRFQLTTEIKTFCAVAKTFLKKTQKVNSFLFYLIIWTICCLRTLIIYLKDLVCDLLKVIWQVCFAKVFCCYDELQKHFRNVKVTLFSRILFFYDFSFVFRP
jgi:hypothetical protein